MANLKVLLCLLKQKYLTLNANKIWLKSNQYIRYKHKNNVKTVQTDPGWRYKMLLDHYVIVMSRLCMPLLYELPMIHTCF